MLLPMRSVPAVYLLHDSQGGEKDITSLFQRLLGERRPGVPCHWAALPFDEPSLSEAAISKFLQTLALPEGAMVVGFQLGGFVAAKLQEHRPDLHVFCIHSPLGANSVRLSGRATRRYAFYSTERRHNEGCEQWEQFAEAYDVSWVYIRHMLAAVMAEYLAGHEVAEAVTRRNRYLHDGARPRGPIPAVYLLHGKGGSPAGSVLRMENVLARHWPNLRFHRPLMPHSDMQATADRSVEYLRTLDIAPGSLMIGVSLGGVVAGAFQEFARPDLPTICINAPTWTDGVKLERWMENRVAIYSLTDKVVGARVANWPELAEAYEFSWLGHDTDPHLKYLVRLIDWFIEGRLAITADRVLDVPKTSYEAAAEATP